MMMQVSLAQSDQNSQRVSPQFKNVHPKPPMGCVGVLCTAPSSHTNNAVHFACLFWNARRHVPTTKVTAACTIEQSTHQSFEE